MLQLSRTRLACGIAWTLLLACLLPGCAGHIPPTYALPAYNLPRPPSEEARKAFGTVGVGWRAEPPRTRLHTEAVIVKRPHSGTGAAVGASAGLRASAEYAIACIAARPPKEFCPLAWLIAAGVGAGAGAVVGGLGGFPDTLPAYVPRTVESIAAYAAAQLNLSQTLAERVLQRVRAGRGEAAALGALAPMEEGEPASFGLPVESVLEISVPEVAFTGRSGDDPLLAVLLTARVRVLRPATGEVLYEAMFEHRGPARALSTWATASAETYRGELDSAHMLLADRIVDEIFFVYLPPPPTRARR